MSNTANNQVSMKKNVSIVAGILLLFVILLFFGFRQWGTAPTPSPIDKREVSIDLSVPAIEKEFPKELRALAKAVAEKLHASASDAVRTPSDQDTRLQWQNSRMDLTKIQSQSTEIQYLADQALAAVSEIITRSESIGNLPKRSIWQTGQKLGAALTADAVVYFTGSTGGIPVPLATIYASADEIATRTERSGTVSAEEEKRDRARDKLEVAMRLLPRVACEYSATPTSTKNDEWISVRYDTRLHTGGVYELQNKGDTLTDCLLEITVAGKTGDKVTFCSFIEKWDSDQTFFLRGNWGTNLEKVDVVLLSPKLSTAVQYLYDKTEHGKLHQDWYKNVRFTNPKYQPSSPYRIYEYQRSFSASIAGYSRLSACMFTVRFINADQNFELSYTDTGWTAGRSWTMTPGNDKLTFEPTKIIAEISFPDSTFVIRETFSVDA